MYIALLGAECTGKTQLAQDLCAELQTRYPGTCWLPETLRTWCDLHGRTPRQDEQAAIADAQWAQLQSLAASMPATGLLVCDTTPLMTAIYSDLVFGDVSLYAKALEQQHRFALTLVTGLDLPWVADGHQRDGPSMRQRVDQRLRQVLLAEGVTFSSVYGQGPARLRHALQAIGHGLGQPEPDASGQTRSRWKWVCDKCSDPDCEHRLFRDLQKP